MAGGRLHAATSSQRGGRRGLAAVSLRAVAESGVFHMSLQLGYVVTAGFRNGERDGVSLSVLWLWYRGCGCWGVGPYTRVCALSPFFLGVHSGHWGVCAYACQVVGVCCLVGGEVRISGYVLVGFFFCLVHFFQRTVPE